MVDPTPKGETLREIAARYGRAYDTLRTQWSRHPAWPAPLGKRGRSYVYDPTTVDEVISKHFDRPTIELEPHRLYSAREIEALTGVSAATIRADRSKGRWPEADDTTGRAHRWYGRSVATTLAERRSYGRA